MCHWNSSLVNELLSPWRNAMIDAPLNQYGLEYTSRTTTSPFSLFPTVDHFFLSPTPLGLIQ